MNQDRLGPARPRIRAAAERRKLPILTADEDFTRFAKILPIVLYAR